MKNLFVEGPFDSSIIAEYLREKNINGVLLREAWQIQVSAEELGRRGLLSNYRSRLIYLASYLEHRGVSQAQVRCIVDLDLEPYWPCGITSVLLRHTDFGAMEIYLFDHEIIGKFLRVALRLKSVDIKLLMADFCQALIFAYFCRVVAARQKWGHVDIEIGRSVKVNGNRVAFDTEHYALRVLNSFGKESKLKEFLGQVRSLIGSFDHDNRISMYGHDYTALFFEYIRLRKGKNNPVRCADAVGEILASIARGSDLVKHSLFGEIDLLASMPPPTVISH